MRFVGRQMGFVATELNPVSAHRDLLTEITGSGFSLGTGSFVHYFVAIVKMRVETGDGTHYAR